MRFLLILFHYWGALEGAWALSTGLMDYAFEFGGEEYHLHREMLSLHGARRNLIYSKSALMQQPVSIVFQRQTCVPDRGSIRVSLPLVTDAMRALTTGRWMDYTLVLVVQKAICREGCYPYTAQDGT